MGGNAWVHGLDGLWRPSKRWAFSLFEPKKKVRGFTTLPKNLGQMDHGPNLRWNMMEQNIFGSQNAGTLVNSTMAGTSPAGYLRPHLWPLQPGQVKLRRFWLCHHTATFATSEKIRFMISIAKMRFPKILPITTRYMWLSSLAALNKSWQSPNHQCLYR